MFHSQYNLHFDTYEFFTLFFSPVDEIFHSFSFFQWMKFSSSSENDTTALPKRDLLFGTNERHNSYVLIGLTDHCGRIVDCLYG